MAKSGPILLIEDDPDDQMVIREVLQKIQVRNEIKFFADGSQVLRYMEQTEDRPFMILSNVHLHKVDGIELRQKIQENPKLKDKSIPFLFLTTDTRKETIADAFDLTVQGYFEKNNTIAELEHTLKVMVDYWTLCKHP